MKTLLRRIIVPYTTKSALSINNKLLGFLNCISTAVESPHTADEEEEEEEEKTATTITTICKSFPENLNWKTLNRKLNSIDVTNQAVINSVLIQLKDPPNAKKALSFFHWSSHFANTTHQTHTYALLIHILVRAKLIKDANALIEAVLTKSVASQSAVHSNRCETCNPDGNGASFVVRFVHSLIGSYDVTSSTPFVFDLVIQVCSKLRMIGEAVDSCFCLGKHGFRLSVISYNTLLHVIQKSDETKLVWRVYEHMIVHGTYPNEMSVKIMISALCKEGKLQSFVDMIDRINGNRCLPRVIVNTCLVFGMIEEGRIEDGLVLLKRMLIKNMIIDTILYSLIVYAKIKLGNLESAWEVFDEMLKRGFKANSFVHTSFIQAYCETGKIDDGDELFKDMESIGLKPYDDTYTHLIVGFSKAERFEKSLNFCKKMVENGYLPSCSAFNEMVKRLYEHEAMCRADEILTLLLDKGFVPDVNTYSHFISGYGRHGDLERVMKIYYEMEYRKLAPGASVFNMLIVSLSQAGRFEEAKKYLSVVKARSLVPSKYAYDTLISSMEKSNRTRDRQFHTGIVTIPSHIDSECEL